MCDHTGLMMGSIIRVHFFWLCWVFVARGLFLVAGSGNYSSFRCAGFSLWWRLLLRSTGSRRASFSSCSMQALKCTGLAALRHVGSSQTRDRTRVPCIGRRILNHCTNREVPGFIFNLNFGTVNP